MFLLASRLSGRNQGKSNIALVPAGVFCLMVNFSVEDELGRISEG